MRIKSKKDMLLSPSNYKKYEKYILNIDTLSDNDINNIPEMLWVKDALKEMKILRSNPDALINVDNIIKHYEKVTKSITDYKPKYWQIWYTGCDISVTFLPYITGGEISASIMEILSGDPLLLLDVSRRIVCYRNNVMFMTLDDWNVLNNNHKVGDMITENDYMSLYYEHLNNKYNHNTIPTIDLSQGNSTNSSLNTLSKYNVKFT